ncbi:MAG: hypothetical protein LC099_03415 [Anaerolineales bacterium]|nr:hypothetical protein [Anaerolineales bacterium]
MDEAQKIAQAPSVDEMPADLRGAEVKWSEPVIAEAGWGTLVQYSGADENGNEVSVYYDLENGAWVKRYESLDQVAQIPADQIPAALVVGDEVLTSRVSADYEPSEAEEGKIVFRDAKGVIKIVYDTSANAWLSQDAISELFNSNMLTYKNAEGQEVTIELTTYEYTNRRGEVVEVIQTPDTMATIKLLADKSKWYPASADLLPLLIDIGGEGEPLWDMLDNYDIGFPPKDKRTWTSPYPRNASEPFMPIFITGWKGGTLTAIRGENGELYLAFSPTTDPVEFKKMSYGKTESVEDYYLQELAGQH